MSFTISHRQASVTRSNVAGLIRHEFRDVDRHNGVETQHSNERIVPDRTPQNRSMIFIDGQPQKMTSSKEILAELDRRLENAGGVRVDKKTGEKKKVGIRKDAGVVRNIVLQLDPTFTRSSEYLLSKDCPVAHRKLVQQHLSEMVDYYGDVYGRHNLLAASLHWDETSPHVHLMVTPIDDQGRVRNASFIPDGRGPQSGLAKNDRAMRQHMIAQGYDAAPEPTGANRNHMSIDEYARYQESVVELEDRELAVAGRERKVADREKSVSEKDQDLAQKATELSQEAQEVEKARQAVQEVWRRSEERLAELEQAVNETRELLSKMRRQSRADYRAAMRGLDARLDGLRGDSPEQGRHLGR